MLFKRMRMQNKTGQTMRVYAMDFRTDREARRIIKKKTEKTTTRTKTEPAFMILFFLS